jgi:cell division protein FtsB
MTVRLQRFDLLVTFGCWLLLGFFAWHTWEGPRGLALIENLEAKTAKLAVELRTEVAEVQRLEAKVALMRPEQVDPDMLEELARSELEMSRRNELIVRLEN